MKENGLCSVDFPNPPWLCHRWGQQVRCGESRRRGSIRLACIPPGPGSRRPVVSVYRGKPTDALKTRIRQPRAGNDRRHRESVSGSGARGLRLGGAGTRSAGPRKTGWWSPGRLRRSIKPLNACRMAVGNVFESCLQPWEVCMPIGIRHSAALPASS